MLAPTLDAPAAGHASHAAQGWWARRSTGDGTVIPDGEVDLMWATGTMPWLAGPDTSPKRVTLPAGSMVLGIRLHTGAARAAFGTPLSTLTDQRVPLDALLSPSHARHVAGRVDHCGDSAGDVAALLLSLLQQLVPADWQPDPVVTATQDALRAGLPVPAHDLSPRQHRRRFTDAVGYGPKVYQRICRIDRFTSLRAQQPDASLAYLAALAGFHDEAHLSRDCVALTGTTPSQLA